MKAYSVDVREKVLRAVDQGYPREQIVKLLGVSRATIKRYLRTTARNRNHHSQSHSRTDTQEVGTAASRTGGAVASACRPGFGRAVSAVGAEPRSPGQHDHDESGPSSASAGRVKKDGSRASERREEERAQWREQMKQMDARRLVVVDECGSNIALTPLYARAPKGQHAYSSVPRNRGKNTTLLASLSLSGVGASLIIEGAVDALAFETYVEYILAPSLSTGQIVVLDNLSAHKGARVRQLIEACGCDLLFLPAYSPDYPPIEETFSKLKAFLRRVGARTHLALQEAIAQGLETVTAQDVLGWFTHCGYQSDQASEL